MRNRKRLLVGVVLAGTMALGGTATAGDEAGGDEGAGASPVPAPAQDEAQARGDGSMGTRITATRQLVNVYWGWTIPNHPGTDERIAAGARNVDATIPATGALRKLLRGPRSVETEIGMLTSIPVGTRLNGINIAKKVATVDLSAQFEAPSGTLDESMRLAQVVFTLTQFDNVRRVKFQIDGVPTDPILSHGFVVGKGLRRGDFAAIRSLVMVEGPFPGARVVNPLTVHGESNTYESTVYYTLTDRGGDGRIIDEGFTTATAGSGTWGTFEFAVDLDALPDYDPGPGAIIVWDADIVGGGMGATVEYPIVLPPRCHGHAATILGTPGEDVVRGTNAHDVIVTRGSDDVVRARGGHDIVCTGTGNDVALGGGGRDLIRAGGGDDDVSGGGGDDIIDGGEGRDELRGDDGSDRVDGGDGRDHVLGRAGDDTVIGGRGGDHVYGHAGRDEVRGNGGRDVLNGGGGRDDLQGGRGDDRLYGVHRDDVLSGDHGDDGLDGGQGVDVCDGGPGTDTATTCEVMIQIP